MGSTLILQQLTTHQLYQRYYIALWITRPNLISNIGSYSANLSHMSYASIAFATSKFASRFKIDDAYGIRIRSPKLPSRLYFHLQYHIMDNNRKILILKPPGGRFITFDSLMFNLSFPYDNLSNLVFPNS